MVRAVLQKMLKAIGLTKATSARDPALPGTDFVARHGLSHRESSDLLTDEARLEIERLKSVRQPHR
jgi:hypothetical protein